MRFNSTQGSGFLFRVNPYGKTGLVDSSKTFSYIDFSGKATGTYNEAQVCKVQISDGSITAFKLFSQFVYVTQMGLTSDYLIL